VPHGAEQEGAESATLGIGMREHIVLQHVDKEALGQIL
jgi:hypothetical protein